MQSKSLVSVSYRFVGNDNYEMEHNINLEEFITMLKDFKRLEQDIVDISMNISASDIDGFLDCFE